MTPIRGLTDRERWPRVGKIHLGHKQEGARGSFPKQAGWFVVHADDTTPAEAAQAFHQVYGDQPKELKIVFPHDDELLFADANYKCYSQTHGLRCKGDGETAQAKWDMSANGLRPPTLKKGSWATKDTQAWEWLNIPCLGEECPMQKMNPPACRAVMNLHFLLPEVAGIGTWQIDTSSFHSIRNIQSNIRLIKAATGGRIQGMPLSLRLTPIQVSPQGVSQKTVYILDLYLNMTFDHLMRTIQEIPIGRLLPPAVDDEEPPEDLFPAETEEFLASKEDRELAELEQDEAKAAIPPIEPEPKKAKAKPKIKPDNLATREQLEDIMIYINRAAKAKRWMEELLPQLRESFPSAFKGDSFSLSGLTADQAGAITRTLERELGK